MTFPEGGAYAEICDDETFDEDGRPKRTGTLVTTVAHLITPVIGSGVLSVAWAVAQLGWIAGTGSIILFSLISLFTSYLLSEFRLLSMSSNWKEKLLLSLTWMLSSLI